MEDKVQNNTQRDYDKDPIVIKDYGAYFQYGIAQLILLIVLLIWLKNWISGDFKEFNQGRLLFEIALLALVIWFLYYLYQLPKKFRTSPSYFYFSNSEIFQVEYFYDSESKNIKTVAPLANVKNVSFCIVSELQERYGRLHYLTPWQLYRKSSIGVHIGKTVLYIRFLLTYILFVLPYKIYRLKKAKEPLWLLKKNLFIRFDNRNYFLVNTYSQKELNELLEYFKIHKIPIEVQTVFIPQAQNQMGWFADKNEIWTNKFNNKKGVNND